MSALQVKYLVEIQSVLNCSFDDASIVMNAMNSSLELSKTSSEVGPMFNLEDIAKAQNALDCSSKEVIKALYLLQQVPEINSPVIYSKIKDFMTKVGCTAEDATNALILMKKNNMPSIGQIQKELNCNIDDASIVLNAMNSSLELSKRNSEAGPMFNLEDIAKAKNALDCSLKEVIKALYLLQQVPEINSPMIYSEIKDFMTKVGCNIEDATNALILMKKNNMPSIGQIQKELNCNIDDASIVLNTMNLSLELSKTSSEVGPMFNLEDIAKAKNALDCSLEEALKALYLLQQVPEINSPVIYSKIKDFITIVDCNVKDAINALVKIKKKDSNLENNTIKDFINKIGCTIEDAINALILMKKINMHLSRTTTIKLIMKKLECSAFETVVTMNTLGKLNPKDEALINYDKIKEAKDAIGCKPHEALKVLNILNNVDYSISYADIKQGTKEMGLTPENTTLALCKLKHYENLGFKPSFKLAEISEAMEQIDCEAMEAVTVLFNLQVDWPKDIPFPLSEIKAMKELIGGEDNLNKATDITIKKQKYKKEIISEKEWHDYLTLKSKFLPPAIIGELLKTTSDSKLSQNRNNQQAADELATDLARMTVVQDATPSTARSSKTKKKGKKGQLEFKPGFLNSKKKKNGKRGKR